jgi:hypothetical protein
MSDFSDMQRGGNVWAAHFLKVLARVSNLRTTVVSIGPGEIQATNDRQVRSWGLEHLFVPFRQESDAARGALRGRLARSAVKVVTQKYFFLWEQEARRQKHIDADFTRIIAQVRPDVIVLPYLFAALFVPSVFTTGIRCCMVTVNNESAFHRALRSQGGPVGAGLRHRLGRWIFRHGNWIANRRVHDYELEVYARCAGLAALTRSDLPAGLPANVVQAVIPPVLESSGLRWSYQANRRLFFVGNANYYPNRMAIEWLCTRLAPELARLDGRTRLNIIGAGPEQVPRDWHAANVNLMGYSTREEVTRQMTSADLFVAPIANNFGAKLKLAECTSHGMPFIATAQAMSGLSFLQSMPELDLEQPAAAARRIVEFLDTPQTLQHLSESISTQMERARAAEAAQWATFLAGPPE